jgi:excisionase family DNA binding protein
MGAFDEGFATRLLPAEGGRLRAFRGGKGGRMLTIADIAEELAVSKATVYKLVGSGALPCVRVLNALRVRREDLDAFEGK